MNAAGTSASEESGGSLCTGLDQIAGSVADRLADPDKVASAIRTCRPPRNLGREYAWVPYTLARGFSGLALSLGLMSEAMDGSAAARWRSSAHRYLEAAVRGLEGVANPPPGLFTGTAGVAAAACVLSEGRHYQRLLTTLSDHLHDSTMALAAAARADAGSLPVSTFDHISGLTGIAALLASTDAERVADDAALGEALAALTALVLVPGRRRGWFTPPEYVQGEWMQRSFPRGNLNCGLAHGVTGILAALSICWRDGRRVPRQDDAIGAAADWLLAQRHDDAWGRNWPLAVAAEPPEGIPASAPSHAAWCYGAPGVARALWLAGAAVAERAYTDAASEAVQDLMNRPAAARQISSPGCCHGTAGLLQVFLAFASDGVVRMADPPVTAVLEQTVQAYRSEHPMGFQSWEEDRWVDQPALLDGAAGIPLVLLETGGRRLRLWRRLLLLD